MSDYELERMDPAAYADAMERERQDPLRPYHLEVARLRSRERELEEAVDRLREECNRLEEEAKFWCSGVVRLRELMREFTAQYGATWDGDQLFNCNGLHIGHVFCEALEGSEK